MHLHVLWHAKTDRLWYDLIGASSAAGPASRQDFQVITGCCGFEDVRLACIPQSRGNVTSILALRTSDHITTEQCKPKRCSSAHDSALRQIILPLNRSQHLLEELALRFTDIHCKNMSCPDEAPLTSALFPHYRPGMVLCDWLLSRHWSQYSLVSSPDGIAPIWGHVYPRPDLG